MLKGIKNHLALRLQRQLVEAATKTLYSELFDFEPILNKLSRNRGGIHLLRASIAIETAARLKNPLSDDDMDGVQKVVQAAEAVADLSVFEDIVDVRRELADLYWSRATIDILRRKLAHRRNVESFEGTMYSIANDLKGPVPAEQRAIFEPICRQLEEATRNVEVAELEALKNQDPDEYFRYKDGLEARELQDEIDANEDEETDTDLMERIAILELKFFELVGYEQ